METPLGRNHDRPYTNSFILVPSFGVWAGLTSFYHAKPRFFHVDKAPSQGGLWRARHLELFNEWQLLMIITYFLPSGIDFNRRSAERQSRAGVWIFKWKKVFWGSEWGVLGATEGPHRPITSPQVQSSQERKRPRNLQGWGGPRLGAFTKVEARRSQRKVYGMKARLLSFLQSNFSEYLQYARGHVCHLCTWAHPMLMALIQYKTCQPVQGSVSPTDLWRLCYPLISYRL